MKKTLYILSLIAVITLTSCQSGLLTNHTADNQIKLEINITVKAMQLPAEIAVPETLPTTIKDSTLLESWIRLYNNTQECRIWDGFSLTGRKLAQYVIDQDVVITWNTSTMYPGSWADRDNTGTLYINPSYQEETEAQMVNLVNEVAHELFHDLVPFNQKADSLYEEYLAFYVGACVSGQSTESFEHIDPTSSGSLAEWFKSNRHGAYLGRYEMYPEDIVAVSLP